MIPVHEGAGPIVQCPRCLSLAQTKLGLHQRGHLWAARGMRWFPGWWAGGREPASRSIPERSGVDYPCGAERWSSGTLPTDCRFTGQRFDGPIKLYVSVLQPARSLVQYLTQSWLVSRGYAVCWSDMLVMGMRCDFRMMRGVVVAEDALLLADVGIRVMHADGISQLGLTTS
jgi:hypothetical protein